MSPRSRTDARRGFSLLEALVSIAILMVVMAGAASLLMGMRSFAQKQQAYTAPRQTGRGAMDYLSYYFAGAGDMNVPANNPDTLIMYYLADAQTGGPLRQASYNNVTDANLADLGTDIVSMVLPVQPMAIPITVWPGFNHASNLDVNFTAGCAVSDAYNLYLFEQATGATPLTNPVSNSAQSGLLTLVDTVTGYWCYFQITSYQQSRCANATNTPPDVIHIVCNPGQSGQIDPPGGHHEFYPDPVSISAGLQFISFRVRNGNLEQKTGKPFDPTTDNPGTAFFPVVENVEDLQVAYLYGLGGQAGQVWNTAQQTLPQGAGVAPNPGHVPTQAGPNQTPDQWDITNVVGVRVNVVSRSLPLSLSTRKLSNLKATTTDTTTSYFYRPASEDHTAGTVPTTSPYYHHRRTTTTLMLRNRMLGS